MVQDFATSARFVGACQRCPFSSGPCAVYEFPSQSCVGEESAVRIARILTDVKYLSGPSLTMGQWPIAWMAARPQTVQGSIGRLSLTFFLGGSFAWPGEGGRLDGPGSAEPTITVGYLGRGLGRGLTTPLVLVAVLAEAAELLLVTPDELAFGCACKAGGFAFGVMVATVVGRAIAGLGLGCG